MNFRLHSDVVSLKNHAQNLMPLSTTPIPAVPVLYLYSATGHKQVHVGVDRQQAPDHDGLVDVVHHGKQQVQVGHPQADGLQHQEEEDWKHQQTSPGLPKDKDVAVANDLA
ncbi:hypothetical protein BgiMline_032079 [Biomphalaria glabrata]